jgi:hypothetical protein
MHYLNQLRPFVAVVDPGEYAIYANFATKAAMNMTDKIFEHNKNYHLSFININRACFRMLNNIIADQFKVSNMPNMTGWNSSMTVCLILEQLENSYGKPDTMSLFHNDSLFRSPFPATKAPEMLFYQIEQCQEIQTIAQDPYMPKQIINNPVRLLMQSGIFPLKEFDTWQVMPIKSYPIPKMFIHEAYSRRLMAMQLRNTAGQQGYVQQNMYNILNVDGGEETDNETTVTLPMVAAAMVTAGGTMMGSTYAAAKAVTITAEVTVAINQLLANKTHIMQQMAAMNIASPPPDITAPGYNVPPIQSMTIPNQQTFPAGGFHQGGGAARGGSYCHGGRRGRWDGCGGSGRNPFVNHMANVGCGNGQQMTQLGGNTGFSGAAIPPAMQPQQQPRTTNFPNIYKRYKNWNVCYSCGFDSEDIHTLMTCPFWKASHQMGFTRENAQQYIAAGHVPCIKGMHKSILPMRRYT